MRYLVKRVLSTALVICLCLTMLLTVIPKAEAAAYDNTHTNTGNQAYDIIGVAKTQLGYSEGTSGYTKYGAWYTKTVNNGVDYSCLDWCAMFISWCARQAGIPESILKNACRAGPSNEAGCFNITWYTGTSYTPCSGDLFFTKSRSHVGLVYYTDGSYFYTIEGNASNKVKTNKYLISDYDFGVPNYTNTAITHTVNTAYGTNFTAYPKTKITAENILDGYHNQIDSTSWIGTSDKCTIHEVYTDGCCKVTYPLDAGGTKTVQ